MTDINLKTLTPDTTLPTTGFLFGADSQASTNPSVYSTQTVATTLLGSTSLTGDTVATSLPVLDLTQTWNSSGTTFTGVRFNAAGSSSTNSAAASLLMDLQVGGTSQFKVDKTGNLTLASNITSNLIAFNISCAGTTFLNNTTYIGATPGFLYTSSSGARADNIGLCTWSAGAFAWTSSNLNTAKDTFITRSTKNTGANIQLGAADAASPVAQTLSVQSVVAGTSNTAGAAFTINGSQGTGTGAGGSIVFQVAPAGGSGTAQNALVAALTINSAGLVSVTPASGSSTSFQALRGSISTPAYSYSTDSNSGTFFGAYNGLNCQQISVGGNLQWIVGQSETGTAQIGPVAWAAKSGTSMAAPDLLVYREAAGVLGVRGTSTSVGAALSFIEQTAPASPAANIVRIYAEDNGLGKTRLMVLFATGAAIPLATEV